MTDTYIGQPWLKNRINFLNLPKNNVLYNSIGIEYKKKSWELRLNYTRQYNYILCTKDFKNSFTDSSQNSPMIGPWEFYYMDYKFHTWECGLFRVFKLTKDVKIIPGLTTGVTKSTQRVMLTRLVGNDLIEAKEKINTRYIPSFKFNLGAEYKNFELSYWLSYYTKFNNWSGFRNNGMALIYKIKIYQFKDKLNK